MKLIDIAKRLQKEFPNDSVNFQLSAWSHEKTSDSFPGFTSCELAIYSVHTNSRIECTSLDDGIAQLKRVAQDFSESAGQMDIDVSERGVIPS